MRHCPSFRPRWSAFRSRKGVALLLTLLIVGLLSASVLSFLRMTHLEAKVAVNTYDFAQAEILAQAGLKGAMLFLAMDSNKNVDDLSEDWAQFGLYATMAAGFFDEGAFTGTIEDLSARFNVNALVDRAGLVDEEYRQPQLERLFSLLELEPEPIPAIIDWLDKNDEPRPYGAENSYYLSLEDPYPCANGPIDTLGQLSLIKGLTPELLYGTEEKEGLLPYLTVYPKEGESKINVNTAGPRILMSLHENLTEDIAQAIINYRAETPFQNIKELKGFMSPDMFSHIVGGELVDVKSSHFLIYIEGRFREARVRITAMDLRRLTVL